jgi:hypothetical protein
MDTATNSSVIVNDSPAAKRAGMSESEWQEAIKFDSTDTGWVIMSIGMAIGAGIVFLPVQVGLMGLLLTRWQNRRSAKIIQASSAATSVRTGASY